eukprot:gene35057-43226_t
MYESHSAQSAPLRRPVDGGHYVHRFSEDQFTAQITPESNAIVSEPFPDSYQQRNTNTGNVDPKSIAVINGVRSVDEEEEEKEDYSDEEHKSNDIASVGTASNHSASQDKIPAPHSASATPPRSSLPPVSLQKHKSALSSRKTTDKRQQDSKGDRVSRGVSFFKEPGETEPVEASNNSNNTSGSSFGDSFFGIGSNIVLTTLGRSRDQKPTSAKDVTATNSNAVSSLPPRHNKLSKQKQSFHSSMHSNKTSNSNISSDGDDSGMSRQSSLNSSDWFGFRSHYSTASTNQLDTTTDETLALQQVEECAGDGDDDVDDQCSIVENRSASPLRLMARSSLANTRASLYGFDTDTIHDDDEDDDDEESGGMQDTGTKSPRRATGPSKLFSIEYDYAIVFPFAQQTQSPDCKYMIHSLIQAGLEVYPYPSVRGDELFVLIRAPLEVLKSIAEKSDFKLLLDPVVLKTTLLRGNPDKRIAPVRIRHDPTITAISPFEHIYLKFQAENDIELYRSHGDSKHPFSRSVRLKLIHFLINAPKRFGGCDMHLSSMIHHKAVRCMFPLHDVPKCNELLERCVNVFAMPWHYPALDLKEYLGEKIALYNVFIGHYSKWLLIPAALGVGCEVVVLITNNFSHPILIFYGILATVWGIFMLEFWKREEHRTAMRWGMIDYVSREADRPEFHGQSHTYSHIDGKEMLYFPPKESRRRVMLSFGIIFTFILLVL